MLEELYKGLIKTYTLPDIQNENISEETLKSLKLYVINCGTKLRNNKDFKIEDIQVAYDGIKWFVFEYLNDIVKSKGENK